MRRQRRRSIRAPAEGTICCFRSTGSSLNGVPGTVIAVSPRLSDGDYLVTLRYDRPVPFRDMRVRHIDALASELCCDPDCAESAAGRTS